MQDRLQSVILHVYIYTHYYTVFSIVSILYPSISWHGLRIHSSIVFVHAVDRMADEPRGSVGSFLSFFVAVLITQTCPSRENDEADGTGSEHVEDDGHGSIHDDVCGLVMVDSCRDSSD